MRMRRMHAPWLLLFAVASGCIGHERVNSHCEWTQDAAVPLNLQNPSHQRHLVADGQLAEELAIRYADAEHKRLFGTDGHGGLIQGGRVRDACMASLVSTIETNHEVTPEQVFQARGHRSQMFDLFVIVSFSVLYWFGSTTVLSRIHRRFSADARAIELAATSLVSLAVSVVSVQLLAIWAGAWEAIRVGNGHLSDYRAARVPWGAHLGELLLAGVLLFWLASVLRHRVAGDDEPSSPSISGPDGVLLQ